MSEENPQTENGGGMDRRKFLGVGAAVAATPALGSLVAAAKATAAPAPDLEEATIADFQAAMTAGTLTSLTLVKKYLARIDALDDRGPTLTSVIEVNPDAESIAQALDKERKTSGPRGPLHGIPILLKDNIDTADKMNTAAGSLALVGPPPSQDATVASRLRDAGAVLLGKANLSEWANFRSFHSSSGWSGRGGQCKNPYVLDRNPCGSSSGSAAAVAANLAAAALGTETDGSIVCPSHQNAVVGIKPTVGLTSRAGVVPIAHSQDTVGPHGRTVADAAAVLGALTGVDPRDPATSDSAGKFYSDYTQFLDDGALDGARIGVVRDGVTGYSEETDGVFEAALQAMSDAGAVLVDPADIPTMADINTGAFEIVVLLYEFKRDMAAYLETRDASLPKTLADLIAFNEAHAEQELKYFLQEWFDLAEADLFDEQTYLDSLAGERKLGGEDGIDAALAADNLDALVAPTGAPAWPTDLVNGDHFLGASSSPAAIAGYPLVNVPAGEAFGLPVGISLMGTAFSEPTLIALAHSFEQATKARRPPQFLSTLASATPPSPHGPKTQSLPAATTRSPLRNL